MSNSSGAAVESSLRTPIPRTAARIAVALRLGSLVVGAPMALLAALPAQPPVSSGWLLVAITGFAGWTGVFTRHALTVGLTSPLMVGDVAVASVLCLLDERLTPLATINDGSSWVATLASLCVVSLPLAWRPPAAIPAGLTVVAAYVTGFVIAGDPAGAGRHAVIMLLQLVCAAAVMVVVRAASDAANAALAQAQRARTVASVEAARRADESVQLRLLHDTVLTTLTLVGTGAITRSAALTERARADLAVVERLTAVATVTAVAPPRVRLREALLDVVRRTSAELTVESTMMDAEVPARVAEAFAGSVGEALRNAHRHAGVGLAELSLVMRDDVVRVEVRDAGRGFDPERVPAHHFGVRQSIIGRMVSVGGEARVRSAPGAGTRWTLDWRRAER